MRPFGKVKLADYLEISHDLASTPGVLPLNIGDAILCACNPMSRNIRSLSLARGLVYTRKDPFNYFSAKLTALDSLKRSKKIPYLPNQNVISELEKKTPRLFTLETALGIKIQANSVFHESCHLLCSAIIEDHRPSKEYPRDAKSFVLNSVLEEAFADTYERLFHLYNHTPVQIFSALFNAYLRDHETWVPLLRRLVKNHGMFETASALILIAIYAHFLFRSLGPTNIDSIQQFLGYSNPLFTRAISNSDRQKLFQMFSCQAATAFRTDVARYYYKSHGFKGDLSKILGFEPIQWMNRHRQEYLPILQDLSRVLAT